MDAAQSASQQFAGTFGIEFGGTATAALEQRKAEALAELKKGLALPSREKDDNESKERARKALVSLQ